MSTRDELQAASAEARRPLTKEETDTYWGGGNGRWRWCAEHERAEVERYTVIHPYGGSIDSVVEQMRAASTWRPSTKQDGIVMCEPYLDVQDGYGNEVEISVRGWTAPLDRETVTFRQTMEASRRARREKEEAEVARLRKERPDLFG